MQTTCGASEGSVDHRILGNLSFCSCFLDLKFEDFRVFLFCDLGEFRVSSLHIGGTRLGFIILHFGIFWFSSLACNLGIWGFRFQIGFCSLVYLMKARRDGEKDDFATTI